MMSVWSPTFALQLLERLESMQQDVVEVLQSGKWGSRQASLKKSLHRIALKVLKP